MLDYLKDITQHTFGLGIIDLAKVTGTEDGTEIEAMAEDRSVIVKAKLHNTIPEFIGNFGLPNLGKLNILLNIPEYRENSKLNIIYKGEGADKVPSGLHFENKSGDFKNDYRFMSAEIINEKLKSVKFRGVKWHVEFEPSTQNILRMKFMSGANSDETTFVAKTEAGALKFYFGDHSSHAGNFVFAESVTGTLNKGFLWPVSVFNSIMNLPGDKVVRFSDEGAAQITVDSGIATYDYIIPAQQK